MLRKAVDERDNTCSTGKYRAPLLECQVCRDYHGFLLVPPTDDVVQEISGSRVAGFVAGFPDGGVQFGLFDGHRSIFSGTKLRRTVTRSGQGGQEDCGVGKTGIFPPFSSLARKIPTSTLWRFGPPVDRLHEVPRVDVPVWGCAQRAMSCRRDPGQICKTVDGLLMEPAALLRKTRVREIDPW